MRDELAVAADLARNRPWDDNPAIDSLMQEAALLLRKVHDERRAGIIVKEKKESPCKAS